MNKAIRRGDKWRVRVYDYTDSEGKVHNRSFTADTKAEAEALGAEFSRSKRYRTATATNDWTIAKAIDKYLELRENLSPTTLNAYNNIKMYAFQDIMTMKVSKVDDLVMQSAVIRESKRISEKTGKQISTKTLKNEYGLLSSALRTVCKKEFQIGKIECQRHIKDYPNPKDVIKAIQGTDIELPCMLALWLSFTMSEIRGLMCSDIKDGYITINRVKVECKGGDIVKDNAKAQTRLRRHKIPPYIEELIYSFPTYQEYAKTHKDGFLIPWSRDKIYGRWQTICKQNNFGNLSFHGLRHENATIMSSLNIPQRVAEDRGGWAKGSTVLPRVYTEIFNDERLEADAKINSYFDTHLEKYTHNIPKKVRKPLKNRHFVAQ